MLLSQHPLSLNSTDDLPLKVNSISDASKTSMSDSAERNRLLAEMAEESTDMISRHTPDNWDFISASPAVKHLLGYETEEIIGMSAYDLYHPDDVEDFKHRSPSVSYDRGLYTHTYRFRCKDGHYTWLESTSRSIRDPETGEMKEILVVSRDASHRIETEQANRRLARVLERSSDLVIFVTPDLSISHLNESAQSTLEVKDLPLDQLKLAQLLPSDSLNQLIEKGFPSVNPKGISQQELNQKEVWSGELEMQGQRKSPIPVSLELLAHYSFQGHLEYYSLVARNLSEAKQAQAELKRYQADINHAARLVTMGELASSLAHELNQPLTAIINYCRGIQRRFSDKEQVSWKEVEFPVEKMAATAMRAGSIIHRMMDFTRKQEPKKQTVNLNGIIEDLIELSATNAEKHGVVLENRISDKTFSVWADPIQLEQVLLNLMMNAIEACSHDEILESRVIITTECLDQNTIEIRVMDNGPGLPLESPNQIFERFFTTKAKGLGMGLAISRSLVESLGGELQAQNNTDGGACFSFTVPLSVN